MLSYIAVFLLITSAIESMQQAEKLIAWIVIGGVLVSLAALYEGATDYNVFNHLDSWIPALEQLPAGGGGGTGRATPCHRVVAASDRARLRPDDGRAARRLPGPPR